MAAEKDFSIGKFLAGVVTGALLASGYVKWGWSKPAVLELPEKMAANVVVAAIDADLYDLSQPLAVRERALEVLAAQRPDEVIRVDREELDHGLLRAFHRRRARREARQVRGQWAAYDVALDKPALRDVLERRYGETEDIPLKQAMLFKAFEGRPFLAAWVRAEYEGVRPDSLNGILREVGRMPAHQLATGEMAADETPDRPL